MKVDQTIERDEVLKPMESLGIDRDSLESLGLSEDDIDRVYRALYVHSNGFFHSLMTIITPVVVERKQMSLLASLWKAYEALLQRCCRTDFPQIVRVLTKEKVEAIKQIKEEYAAR